MNSQIKRKNYKIMHKNTSSHKHAIYICDRCLTFLNPENNLKDHDQIDRMKINECTIKLLTPPRDRRDNSHKILEI